MSSMLRQYQVKIQDLARFLRGYDPSKPQSAEDWSKQESTGFSPGMLIFCLERVSAPSGLQFGKREDSGETYRVRELCIVVGRDNGRPLVVNITASAFELRFLEVLMLEKARKAILDGKDFLYVAAKPSQPLGTAKIREIEQLGAQYSQGGSRRTLVVDTNSGPQEPAMALLSAMGVKLQTGGISKQVLDIGSVCHMLFTPEGRQEDKNKTLVKQAFSPVPNTEPITESTASGAGAEWQNQAAAPVQPRAEYKASAGAGEWAPAGDWSEPAGKSEPSDLQFAFERTEISTDQSSWAPQGSGFAFPGMAAEPQPGQSAEPEFDQQANPQLAAPSYPAPPPAPAYPSEPAVPPPPAPPAPPPDSDFGKSSAQFAQQFGGADAPEYNMPFSAPQPQPEFAQQFTTAPPPDPWTARETPAPEPAPKPAPSLSPPGASSPFPMDQMESQRLDLRKLKDEMEKIEAQAKIAAAQMQQAQEQGKAEPSPLDPFAPEPPPLPEFNDAIFENAARGTIDMAQPGGMTNPPTSSASEFNWQQQPPLPAVPPPDAGGGAGGGFMWQPTSFVQPEPESPPSDTSGTVPSNGTKFDWTPPKQASDDSQWQKVVDEFQIPAATGQPEAASAPAREPEAPQAEAPKAEAPAEPAQSVAPPAESFAPPESAAVKADPAPDSVAAKTPEQVDDTLPEPAFNEKSSLFERLNKQFGKIVTGESDDLSQATASPATTSGTDISAVPPPSVPPSPKEDAPSPSTSASNIPAASAPAEPAAPDTAPGAATDTAPGAEDSSYKHLAEALSGLMDSNMGAPSIIADDSASQAKTEAPPAEKTETPTVSVPAAEPPAPLAKAETPVEQLPASKPEPEPVKEEPAAEPVKEEAPPAPPAPNPATISAQHQVFQEPRLVMNEMATLMAKLEQQVAKAGKKLNETSEGIRQALNTKLSELVAEAAKIEKDSQTSVTSQSTRMTKKLDDVSEEVRLKISDTAANGRYTIKQLVATNQSQVEETKNGLYESLRDVCKQFRVETEALTKSSEERLNKLVSERTEELQSLINSISSQLNTAGTNFTDKLNARFERFKERMTEESSSVVRSLERNVRSMTEEIDGSWDRASDKLIGSKGDFEQTINHAVHSAELGISQSTRRIVTEMLIPRLRERKVTLRTMSTELARKFAEESDTQANGQLLGLESSLGAARQQLHALVEECMTSIDNVGRGQQAGLEEIFKEASNHAEKATAEVSAILQRTETQIRENETACKKLAETSSMEGDPELTSERDTATGRVQQLRQQATSDLTSSIDTACANLEQLSQKVQQELSNARLEQTQQVREASENGLSRLREAIQEAFSAIQTARDQYME